jgi:hypothetical protein
MDEEEKPLFLRADKPETWDKPDDDLSWGDWTLKPGKKLSFRHRQAALMKATGATNKKIAEALGYCESRICTVLGNKKVIEEIERQVDRLYADTAENMMKRLTPYATDHMEHVLTSGQEGFDDDPEVKISHKNEIAKWLLEKETGKAKQEIEVGGNLIGNLIEQLDLIGQQGKQLTIQGDIIDVTPDGEDQAKTDEWETWLGGNLAPTKALRKADGTHTGETDGKSEKTEGLLQVSGPADEQRDCSGAESGGES